MQDNQKTASKTLPASIVPEKRTNILVCLDGSAEGYHGLRYASKLTTDRSDTDVTLVYVRPIKHPSDAPGMTILKQGRDILLEKGFFKNEWVKMDYERKARGNENGTHSIKYTSNKTRQQLLLQVRDAQSMVKAILDEAHFYEYDFLIIPVVGKDDHKPEHIHEKEAIEVATEHDGTVILVRAMEEGHGHFVHISPHPDDIEMAVKDAQIASRCGCPIHLYAVEKDETELPNAQQRINNAKLAIEDAGFKISSAKVEQGEPVWRITENGREHSLIVISDKNDLPFFKRLFEGNQAHTILRKARNSVMIIR